MHVIATAGHVDHGKSTLVKALTGTEPDRLTEERRRGLSIELGYCWTSLPGGDEVAFVDVPGHERFVSTMLAGVGPVPAVLFVVAADDPWMPQAAEHLAALNALGVDQGLVAVTRSDLADPRPAAGRALAELRKTSFGDVVVVPVSARTGAGMDDLRIALADLLHRLPAPEVDADVRLWVDRRFHIKGAGTVVTATLAAGRIKVGDRLASVDGALIRVRGIQALGRDVREVGATARVALSLAGSVPPELSRGSWLVTPDAWLATSIVDVRTSSPDALPERPLLHIGATSVAVRCRPLGGEFTRLAIDGSLPLRVGDRLLVRDPGSRKVWGATVVDPDPPRLHRRGAARERAETLASSGGAPSIGAEIRRRGVVRRSRLRRLGYDVERAEPLVERAGDWLLDASLVSSLQRRLRKLVVDHDAAHPLDPGLTPAVAAQRLGLPTADLIGCLVAPPLRLDDGRITNGGSVLPAPLLRSLDLLTTELAGHPFAAPSADRLAELGLDPRAVGAAARAGRVLRLTDGVVLMPGADQAAADRLAGLPQPFTVSQARLELESSRRVVLPLLAHLDRLGLTRRLPDDRRVVHQPAP